MLSDIRLELSRLNAAFVPFTAETRKSGIDYQGTRIRKGAAEAVKAFVLVKGGECEQTRQAAGRRDQRVPQRRFAPVVS